MSTQELGFKAEVQQLLDLMVHSIYSDREVFLRELISNAADALDKGRFLALTRSDLVPTEDGKEGIRISVDAEAGTIAIDDDGVGMTRDEVIENLGTIAHSGSKNFLKKVKEGGGGDAPSLIGQFGVGFYSCFMVAKRVVVETRSALPDATPVRWISEGGGTFTVDDTEREFRGTTILIELRDDAKDEFQDAWKISEIVKKHSDFLSWPVEVDGEQANAGKAIWLENPSDVTDEAANDFYKSMYFDWQAPDHRIHLKVDSPLQYSAMLFVPSVRPHDLFHPDAQKGPRLYARRVLIADHAADLLPDWLRFVRGVVDSEDISLNVSREMIQKTPVVKKIRDALTNRILKDLGKLADEAEGHDPNVIDADAISKEPTYAKIWRNFGVVLKEGYYHNKAQYGDKLAPLLRFNALSHADDKGLVSLAAYKAAMKEGQDTIWFLTAESRAAALHSPHLEAFRKRGWDVLLLTEPVDEWLMSTLTEFDGAQIKSVSRGALDLKDDEDTQDNADIAGLGPWMKDLLGDAITAVRSSTRLTDSPCVLVDSDAGVSANMERILRQANQGGFDAKRTLELNVKHPIVKNLVALHEKGRTAAAEPIARLLYDEALLLEGSVKDPAAIGRRLQELLQSASASALADA